MSELHASESHSGIVLLVDDDLGDQELTRRAFRHESLKVDLRTVDDGEQALEYLRHEGQFADPKDAPRPDLILLDLNMPRKNGREVLEALRNDDDLSRIPVVVLTTSQQDTDIAKSYGLGCNSYIQKPVDLLQFTAAVRQVAFYWFNIVTLPPRATAKQFA